MTLSTPRPPATLASRMLRPTLDLVFSLSWVCFALPGHTHEWYPAYCCSGQDCYEIMQDEVEFAGQGYFIKATGEYFPRDAVPESPDGKFHRCSVGGQKQGRTLCLFAPAPAF
ncbi:hypothetical protein EZH22_23100 [Xanthobacter dioxanivorans]|uniref:Uncharacterized protein n=1 Tax=Xanthobacter dioxanivorans TaxID=2528964 RepID=A0A974PLN4_9HYPH|nr:hypothetical protein [Xanthobacter dioxanivorans]QRG05882.1 hypothetical protein EZH22_23100 [Xanthobacter dioxanivorans]